MLFGGRYRHSPPTLIRIWTNPSRQRRPPASKRLSNVETDRRTPPKADRRAFGSCFKMCAHSFRDPSLLALRDPCPHAVRALVEAQQRYGLARPPALCVLGVKAHTQLGEKIHGPYRAKKQLRPVATLRNETEAIGTVDEVELWANSGSNPDKLFDDTLIPGTTRRK